MQIKRLPWLLWAIIVIAFAGCNGCGVRNFRLPTATLAEQPCKNVHVMCKTEQ